MGRRTPSESDWGGKNGTCEAVVAATPGEGHERHSRSQGLSKIDGGWLTGAWKQQSSGRAPQALAAVRNAVLGLLHGHHVPNGAAALRACACAWSPPPALCRLLDLLSPYH